MEEIITYRKNEVRTGLTRNKMLVRFIDSKSTIFIIGSNIVCIVSFCFFFILNEKLSCKESVFLNKKIKN